MTSRMLCQGLVVVTLIAAAAQAQGSPRAEAASRPVDSTSIEVQPGTPPELAAVLTRACGDCHSNTMVSRWYTRIPPFSTMMSHGAKKGRNAVNFAVWTSYSPEQQAAFMQASCTDAKAGTMPVKAYLHFRAEARLSAADIETICTAARQAVQAAAAARARTER